jgi:hypothetical protein
MNGKLTQPDDELRASLEPATPRKSSIGPICCRCGRDVEREPVGPPFPIVNYCAECEATDDMSPEAIADDIAWELAGETDGGPDA